MLFGGGKEEKERTNPGDEDLSTGRRNRIARTAKGGNPTERTGQKKKSHRNGLKDWTEMNPGTSRRSRVGRSRSRRIESGKHLTGRFSEAPAPCHAFRCAWCVRSEVSRVVTDEAVSVE